MRKPGPKGQARYIYGTFRLVAVCVLTAGEMTSSIGYVLKLPRILSGETSSKFLFGGYFWIRYRQMALHSNEREFLKIEKDKP